MLRYKMKKVQSILWISILAVVALTIIIPYIWVVVNSLKEPLDFYRNPYSFLLKKVTLDTYISVWTRGSIGLYTKNSFFYAITVIIVQLTLDSLAAYAFARLDFKGRDFLFLLFLITMVIPVGITIIPSYLVVYNIGLANRFLGVVIPSFARAFGIFMLRQFFLGIPREIEDSAKIDGAGYLTIYVRIIIPLAKPALITLGIFLFMGQWKDFLWPLIVLSDSSKYPITVGITFFRLQTSVIWPNVFAASVLASLPIIVVFLLTRRHIMGGIAISGLKG